MNVQLAQFKTYDLTRTELVSTKTKIKRRTLFLDKINDKN